MFFSYTQSELDYLSEKDGRLGMVIAKIGYVRREIEPDFFTAFVQSIIGQQVSTKAYLTVFGRLKNLCGERVEPAKILSLDTEAMRICGISEKKISSIVCFAEALETKKLDSRSFVQKSDEEIIRELTAYPGIGVWTAEMLLLFSLQRKNILSYGDFGIKKGLCLLHGIDRLDKKKFNGFKALYSPYASAASLYLWEIAKDCSWLD